MPADRSRFYHRWIIANALAEAAGLGGTFLLGPHLSRAFEADAGALTTVAGLGAAVALGTLLEGVLVGWAQARVLRQVLDDLPARTWIGATALGAGAAWLMGMLPSTLMALTSSADGLPRHEPPPLVQYALAVVLGLVVGPVLAFSQAQVLRNYVPGAYRWLGANAAAWALGLPLIFVGMDFVPWTRGGVWVSIGPVIICAIAGAVVGAVHGRRLQRLVAARIARRERQ